MSEQDLSGRTNERTGQRDRRKHDLADTVEWRRHETSSDIVSYIFDDCTSRGLEDALTSRRPLFRPQDRNIGLGVGLDSRPNKLRVRRRTCSVCLKIEIHEIHEIHKIYEIHMPKYRNSPTMYEIHCLKIEIHKGHEIHSKATLAKYRNPRNPQTVRNPHWQDSQQTTRQLL